MPALRKPTPAAAYMGPRKPYLAEIMAESGKPRMKAPATERPWKMPRFTARRSGIEASVTYAWQTVFMQLDAPSMTSAK